MVERPNLKKGSMLHILNEEGSLETVNCITITVTSLKNIIMSSK
jgi:hypothetical protein